MNKTKIISTIGAAAMLMTGAIATTASAQPWRDHDQRYDNTRLTTGYVDSLDWRINEAARNRVISWNQANQLRAQLRDVQPLAWRVETGRASQREYARLSNVVDRIERATRGYASNGRYDRYDRYGYNDRRY